MTLVYNTYISALTQRVTEQDVLPISPDILETDSSHHDGQDLKAEHAEQGQNEGESAEPAEHDAA